MNLFEGNPRRDEYEAYLNGHIGGVKQAWIEQLMPYLLTTGEFDAETLGEWSQIIEQHDASKYDDVEWDAYCNYFYPAKGYEKDEEAFDLAWLNHQHVNKHHPQHWILVRDSGELVPLEMEPVYVAEMVCDWQSFSLRNPESTAYKWYQDNKDKMLLHSETRKLVEKWIEAVKEPLEK